MIEIHEKIPTDLRAKLFALHHRVDVEVKNGMLTNSQRNEMFDAFDRMIREWNSVITMYDRLGQRRP